MQVDNCAAAVYNLSIRRPLIQAKGKASETGWSGTEDGAATRRFPPAGRKTAKNAARAVLQRSGKGFCAAVLELPQAVPVAAPKISLEVGGLTFADEFDRLLNLSAKTAACQRRIR